MDSHERKRAQVQRHLRSLDKHIGYEEEKRRKAASRERKNARGARGPRRREWSDGDGGWDDEESFERIDRAAVSAPASRGTRPAFDASLPRARIAAVHRGRVELDDGRPARLAGVLAADPELSMVVGDEVAWSEHEGVVRIEGVVPRRSCLARSDPGNPHRELAIAANVDVAVIVAAAVDPPLRPGLVDRFLLGLERGGIDPVVCVNKVDLLDAEGARELEGLLVPYVELGLDVVRCSAAEGAGVDELRSLLRAKTCVFVGHSGVGKSSLLNALDPGGERSTGDVRAYDGRGRHTTTSSSLRELADGTCVIDTPGVRSFGLAQLTLPELRAAFPELEELASSCRFPDCTHVHEPDCAVEAALEEGRLHAARVDSYRRLAGEL